MADQIDSTVADGATTPAPAESVETIAPTDTAAPDTTSEENPFESVWDTKFGQAVSDEGEDVKDAEVDGKPTIEPAKTEEKPEEKPEGEKPGEEKKEGEEADPLAEIFADKPDEKEVEPTADELAAMKPEELLERQKNKYAKDWAERNAKKAEIVKAFQFETTPIADVAKQLEEVSEGRYAEFSQYAAHSLVDANPDATFQRAYAVKMLAKDPNFDISTIPSLDDIIAGPAAAPAPAGEAAEVPQEISKITEELDKALDWDWRDPAHDDNFLDDRELAMAKTVRNLEAAAKASVTGVSEKDRKIQELEKQLQGVTEQKQTTAQTELEQKLNETISEYRTSISERILPHILRNTGLEPSKDDTPEIAAFKSQRAEYYTGTAYEKANNQESRFEKFAYNESSVASQIEKVIDKIVSAQALEVQAKLKGDKAAADKYHAEAEAEAHPFTLLLSQANKEFKAKYVAPDLELIGKLSGKLAAPIKAAAERIEVVNSGSSPGADVPAPMEADTAEDVWNNMAKRAEENDRLRAAA